ncbi:SNF2 family N-terminal domain-containing protein [Macrophomina phaseolina]|uniref:Chromatin-remodeling ATPase INO80 n=1 Tax=Macrophomina phaseolina TaxID=35725 RepID=A0ABQ8FZP1_9PEZI|nr:SNF2 family N-terminal domain-containing protein [Macrophomina phaseolina]
MLPVTMQRLGDGEEQGKRDTMPGDHQTAYAAHSPTQTPFPPERARSSNPSTPAPLPGHPSYAQPASPSALPPIASALYPRDPPSTSKYYDPTSDQAPPAAARPDPRYNGHYPAQAREPYSYADSRPAGGPYRSPVAASFPPPLAHPPPQSSHPAYQVDRPPHSPSSPKLYHDHNRSIMSGPPVATPRRPSAETPARADPMSLSSIMSGSDPAPAPATSSYPTSTPQPPRSYSGIKTEHVAPFQAPVDARSHSVNHSPERAIVNGTSEPLRPIAGNINEDIDPKAVDAEYAKIEHMDLSDHENPALEAAQLDDWKLRRKRRFMEVEAKEIAMRKRRRTAHVKRLQDSFATHAASAKIHYFAQHEGEAWQEVQAREIADEKERKKDMQRKRRREKTLQNEFQKRDEALEKAQNATDEEEARKWRHEAEKAELKAKNTNRLLQGGTPNADIREVTPHAPNLEGGTMTTFQMSEETPKDGRKAKGRSGARPRKSKEQKQAEKDAAAAAQLALDRGDELPTIAPKEELRLEALKGDRSFTEESSPPASIPTIFAPYESKEYHKLYDTIWKDLARKDVPKVCRIKDNSLATKQSNLRKTAQLASKEARRWQLRTNKSMKDVQARAKRSMREMLSFWKRNERDERDQRKMAERQELENAKKAEAEREANRQKRKLNFLISQTELYSHFIGKKVKTDEVERSTDDVDVSKETVKPGESDAHTVNLPESNTNVATKVTNFDQLDFDAEDETALHEAAMANAQNAVKEAQDRARAFNQGTENAQSQFDDNEEMNFQNPTSLQSMDIAQPKMLSCQLKEYQLKGLNWLVNLYEQGINGILADEMGLGKTVQSISVMAYLAEVHNIWGPFLVIAPASTLHNWQQEITKFVPDLKTLPYWGNAKDRKVLRKFWDRKHITYRKESPFHVLVTSYQLVVQDAQYFQKIRWQYMILDEAQAIKSSQSSRWKSLLGFHCRNRLLLTGTPIQNNMQELWALLHFIMPSLFDSHDEFSDWFSKDIESHAQSNTKLNEDQLKRLHMILKPFMLRRIKKHVQKELGDKIEEDVFCDLTYRQRAYYTNLRNKISIMDLIEKAAVGDDQDTATLMNLVMQFRKVCNHPDLFERAETHSPFAFASFAETASFMREGYNVAVAYSVRNLIEYRVPRLIGRGSGRLNLAGPDNPQAGWRGQYLGRMMNIWSPDNSLESSRKDGAFSFLRFVDTSAQEAAAAAWQDVFQRAVEIRKTPRHLGRFKVAYDEDDGPVYTPAHALFNIVEQNDRQPLAEITNEGILQNLLNISKNAYDETGLAVIETAAKPGASAPPIDFFYSSQGVREEQESTLFNAGMRSALFGINERAEEALLEAKVDPINFPTTGMITPPANSKSKYTHITVPSMRRFVTDSGKLATLDKLLRKLKEEGHRVLLYFQMTRMIDLMEEYLTYRNYKYCRLDGSTKLEDRRDTVADFQTRPEIFVFLLSTRAGGLGINLTSADTVIFYDSDWNPTIDSQAMDRAHRLGQTKQVTVYRLITRGTIEERIRKRALQKEEVQRVVISGGAGAQVDFNTRSRENRTKDIAMWLADDDQAEMIERKEAELAAAEANAPAGRKRKAPTKKKAEVNLDDMYHEGEGNFDDGSAKPSGAATPVSEVPIKGKRKGVSKKAKTLKQRLAIADGSGDVNP